MTIIFFVQLKHLIKIYMHTFEEYTMKSTTMSMIQNTSNTKESEASSEADIWWSVRLYALRV